MARWSGPPPLLIGATVLGVVIALTAGGGDDEPRAVRASTVAEVASPTPSVTASPAPTPTPAPAPPTATTTPPVDAAPDAPDPEAPTDDVLAPPLARRDGPPQRQLLGLATFNQDRSQDPAAAAKDAATIVRRPGVSIVAWQEGERFGSVYAGLRSQGWTTVHPRVDGVPGELAISWRSERFRLVSSKLHTVTYETARGDVPYPSRHVLRVTLRELTSRRLVTVVDTHLPAALTATDDAGSYRDAMSAARGRLQLEVADGVFDRVRGRWVLGAGDYGFGSYAELERQPRGGMSRVFAGTVLSTYAVRGTEGLDPTDTVRHRYADYVHVDRVQLDRGRIEVVGHRTLDQATSDHRPLIAWLALS